MADANQEITIFGPGICPIGRFWTVANRTVRSDGACNPSVSTQSASSSACRAWAALRGGPGCPRFCRGLPETPPQWPPTTTTPQRRPLPPVRSLSPPTAAEEPARSRHHDAAAAPRRPQEVPPAGLVARITAVASTPSKRRKAKRRAGDERLRTSLEMLRRTREGARRAAPEPVDEAPRLYRSAGPTPLTTTAGPMCVNFWRATLYSSTPDVLTKRRPGWTKVWGRRLAVPLS